jgi:anoctamin-8
LSVANIDLDAVEVNGLKFPIDNSFIIDYFAESLIDLGYILMFSAAFPIGPAVSILMNALEMRMKIITYLHVY